MFIDDIERTGSVTRVRVIDAPDANAAATFTLASLWDGMGDYDEVIDQGDGVFEVVCS